MSLYEREYERNYGNGGWGGGGGWRPEGAGGGIQLGWPKTVVGWVLLVNLAVYVAELAFNQPGGANALLDLLHLQSDWWRAPWKIYGLLTYGFLHSTEDFFHIAGNMFGFWLFGRELERRLGGREFLTFYLTAILVGGLAFTLGQAFYGVPASAIGASAGTVAVTILFAVLYPNLRVLFMFVIPMPMWVLGCLIVASDLFGAIGRSGNVAFTAHLGGALFAWLYVQQGWRLSDWVPDNWSLSRLRRGPRLRVHQGYDDDDYGRGKFDSERYDDEPEPPPKPDKLEEETERVLAKISAQGQDSLTRAERRILEKASRRARERRS